MCKDPESITQNSTHQNVPSASPDRAATTHGKTEKQARLAKALRANLRHRKQAARAQKANN